MKAIRIGLSYSSRSCTSASTALVFALALCLFGMSAKAQVPSSGDVVVNQSMSLGALPGNGAQSGGEPAGDTMAVNSLGDLIATNTYNNKILLFAPQGTTPTVLGTLSNPNGVAVDSQNNLFIGFSYSPTVLKIPYVKGAYAAIAATSSSTPNCTGTDTVECIMSKVSFASGSGVVSMVFDSKGDLFFGTTNQNQGGNNPNTIYECTAACLYTGSPAPAVIYTEPTASAPDTTGQLSIGGMAIDVSGNLFFTDSAIGSTNNQESFLSNINELPFTAGTGYATTPTVIYTYTPATPANYDAEIDGVATSPNGTVYALLQNTTGILAFPSNSGTYSNKTMYLVSTQSGKLMSSDSFGNLYEADNNGNIYEIGINNLTATPSAVGIASTATNLTTILNDGGCSPAPIVTFTGTGASSSAFSVATTGACTATSTGGASYATTLTFTPPVVGTTTATFTATDTNGNTGTIAVSGSGTGTVATPSFSVAPGSYTAVQTVTISDATVGASIYYTTDGSTPGASTGTSTLYSGPLTVSVSATINAIAVDSGDVSSAVASATYSITLPGATATPTLSPAGSFAAPQVITITDATTGAAIYFTTDGSTPTASSTLYVGPIIVASTEHISAIAVGSGLSASPVVSALYTITLPASAFQNIVMSQSTLLGALPGNGAQSGGEPAGDTMAVNAFGDLIATNTYNNKILLFPPLGTTPTVLGTLSNPNGVAVDSQNNLYIGFSYGSTVLKVPYVNGAYAAIAATSSSTPNCTGADTVECVMSNVSLASGSGVVSLVFDSKGDLFFGTTNQNQGGNNPNTIYECTAACLYTGSPAPQVLFVEPKASAPDTTGQLSIGGMAIDASGNLFFTDSAIGSTNNQESFLSNVNELPYTSGTGYAATPTVIYTYTPATPANYDAEIDGVATSPNGTVYVLLQNTAGILAFPSSSGTYSSKNVYLVSTQSGKLMTSDGLGNLYEADNNGNVYQIAVDNLTAPTSPVQNPSTATNVTTFLNDGGCTTTPPTVTFTVAGTSASAFTAATTGACTSTTTPTTAGASFATTINFSPLTVGTNSATLTATDSLSNTGTALISGDGTPAPPAATPTFSVTAGTYTTIQTVTITDTSTNASIYYTTDGSTPTTSSTPYTGPITVGVTETLNAFATGNGFANSPVATALYTINLPTAATPTFSVAGGTYTAPQTVSIAESTAGASVYYTTDGSTPTAKSIPYTGPITVGVTETVNAIAVATNYNNSVVASANYVINLPNAATPAFSVAAGTYATVQTVSISDATTGATIYYTTDGSTPTTKSTVYSGSIMVAVSTTINALAVAPPNYNNSAIASAAYVINLPPPAITLASSSDTVLAQSGTGSVTLTITANAAFNGSVSFSCSGFLPIGATCAFAPTSVKLAALANGPTKLTVTIPATSADLHRGSSGPVVAATMLAGILCLVGLRKRCRLQIMLLFVVSIIGLGAFTGCTTTSSSFPTSSQIVVDASGASCPVTAPNCTTPTQVTGNIPLVLTVQ